MNIVRSLKIISSINMMSNINKINLNNFMNMKILSPLNKIISTENHFIMYIIHFY